MIDESENPIIEAQQHLGHVEAIPNLLEQSEYSTSTLKSKLGEQQAKDPQNPPVVAFSDIDGTYIYTIPEGSTGADLEQYRKYQEATALVTSILNSKSIPIACVSGRDLALVSAGQEGGDPERFERERLPKFDLVIGAVGTEIHILQLDGSYKKDTIYEKYLRETIGYDRLGVRSAAQLVVSDMNVQDPERKLKFQHRDSDENIAAYLNDPEAKAHGVTREDAPQEFKVSLDFEGTTADADEMKKALRSRLDVSGFTKVKVVVCFGKTIDAASGKIKWNVDLVPVTKKDAIQYITEHISCLGIVAGDSGNDEEMILGAGSAAVVVGGMKAELQSVIEEHVSDAERAQLFRRHFTKLAVAGHPDRLTYVEPSKVLKASQSLVRAIKAFQLLRALRAKSV